LSKLFLLFFILPCVLWGKSINGFIRDAENGEVLAYANIFLKNTQIGTTTDDHGYFVMDHAPKDSILVVKMMGYETVEMRIADIVNQLPVNISLQPNVLEFGEIVKTAEREHFEREVEISRTTISARQLGLTPTLAEADIMRMLLLVPGVISHNDFSSQLYVRGGSPDQNLILLDGATVYNPFHLLGLFSTFNTDAVKEVEFISGGFSAEYGGRLSSVLNITNNAGNSKKFEAKVGISLLSSKATIQGPIPKGSFLLSARRTYFDQLLKNTDYEIPYYFYDFQGKINLDITPNHRVTLSSFSGSDILDFATEDTDDNELDVSIDWNWGNRTTMLKWQWIMHPELFLETRYTQSRFNLNLDLNIATESQAAFNIENSILDHSLQSDFNYFGISDHALKFGIAASKLAFKYGISIDQNNLFDYNEKPDIIGAYVQDQFQWNEKLSFKTGVRYDYYSIGSWHTFAPRLGLKYKVHPNFAIKGSAGVYHQFLTTAYSDEQNFSFFDLWFPITERYKPQRADHLVGGFEWWLPNDFILTTEAYYKKMYNLLELNSEGRETNPADDFYTGDGHAWGIEFLMKRTAGSLHGWLAYSLAFTKRTINGDTFYPKYDRRHNINFVLYYDLGRNWQAGGIFTLGSGMPYTPILGKYVHYEWDLNYNTLTEELYNIEGEKNSARYPVYHRMDLSIRKKWQWNKFSCSPYLQIINLYNRKNVFFYFWDHDSNPSEFRQIDMFPFLPTLGVDFEF